LGKGSGIKVLNAVFYHHEVVVGLVGYDFLAVAVKDDTAWWKNFFAFLGNFLGTECPGFVEYLHVKESEEIDPDDEHNKAQDYIASGV
jgi:hypothetical protein